VDALNIALIVAGLVLLSVLLIYNHLVRSRMRTLEAWSGIDVQLKRRADLVPNLVETVRGYAAHERQTFEELARARSAAHQAQGPAQATDANAKLTAALARLFALVEAYPVLRASESFLNLQNELSDIEEKIAYARQFYNRNVLDYNTRINTFPRMLIARLFAFQPFEFFEADEPARAAVKVEFSSREKA
jgi:LemA protein